jgi:hypothetical protein
MPDDNRKQEADFLLACAHHTQAAARLLPAGNVQRKRLELLAADLANVGRSRQPNGRRPMGVA